MARRAQAYDPCLEDRLPSFSRDRSLLHGREYHVTVAAADPNMIPSQAALVTPGLLIALSVLAVTRCGTGRGTPTENIVTRVTYSDSSSDHNED
jgi:hypothetical protein